MGRSFARIRSRLLLTGALVATTAHAGTLTLEDVLAQVRANNPMLHAAAARASAADHGPARAGAYDDPVVAWEAWNIPESLAIDRADNNIIRLAQKIPFPGKRGLAADMARHDAEVMHRDADATVLDAITDAKRAFAELWRAHRLHALSERTRTLATHMGRLVEQRYAAGAASQAEVLRMQVEITHAVGDVATSALAVDEALAGLNTTMGAPPDASRGVPADPERPALAPAIATLVTQALQVRPEIAARHALTARESTALRLAEKGYLPDFEVSVGRFRNSGASNGFGAMASMTIPLAWRSKYDAGVAEANARIVSATAERRRLEDLVRRDVHQAYLRATAALVQYDLLASTHLPHADQALRTAEAAYVAGTSDLTALLDMLRTVTQVHRDHVSAATAFELAYADLERAVGADLPRTPHRRGRRETP